MLLCHLPIRSPNYKTVVSLHSWCLLRLIPREKLVLYGAGWDSLGSLRGGVLYASHMGWHMEQRDVARSSTSDLACWSCLPGPVLQAYLQFLGISDKSNCTCYIFR